jgi:molecular chaperone GrpE (heat shock protein)
MKYSNWRAIGLIAVVVVVLLLISVNLLKDRQNAEDGGTARKTTVQTSAGSQGSSNQTGSGNQGGAAGQQPASSNADQAPAGSQGSNNQKGSGRQDAAETQTIASVKKTVQGLQDGLKQVNKTVQGLQDGLKNAEEKVQKEVSKLQWVVGVAVFALLAWIGYSVMRLRRLYTEISDLNSTTQNLKSKVSSIEGSSQRSHQTQTRDNWANNRQLEDRIVTVETQLSRVPTTIENLSNRLSKLESPPWPDGLYRLYAQMVIEPMRKFCEAQARQQEQALAAAAPRSSATAVPPVADDTELKRLLNAADAVESALKSRFGQTDDRSVTWRSGYSNLVEACRIADGIAREATDEEKPPAMDELRRLPDELLKELKEMQSSPDRLGQLPKWEVAAWEKAQQLAQQLKSRVQGYTRRISSDSAVRAQRLEAKITQELLPVLSEALGKLITAGKSIPKDLQEFWRFKTALEEFETRSALTHFEEMPNLRKGDQFRAEYASECRVVREQTPQGEESGRVIGYGKPGWRYKDQVIAPLEVKVAQ